MKIVDKDNMTLQENIYLAKRLLVDNIFRSAKLEGLNVTFPETKTILDGVSVGNLNMSDVETILNLRDAWKYLLINIEEPFTLEFVNIINGYVARNESLEWGVLRKGNVYVTGTKYVPPIPDDKAVRAEIEEILKLSTPTEQAIRYFTWGIRSQLYYDGNKRTSTLCANKILISHGKGLLSVPEEYLLEFNQRLTKFYDTNDYDVIEPFIYERCLLGFNPV
ncbi:Fic family protein [Desulfitobacterium sp. AusDCA]|uniref:Fic family protein n=1 Tax=Desulfitobacterium sp. AusDCA TaxID=3240383 RepID=UPI003DA70522